MSPPEDKTMTEKSAEDFIPGQDELDSPGTLINFNINDVRIAEAKEEFKAIDAAIDMDAARKAKRVLTKMRTTLGEAHKEQKSEALAHGQKLDAEKRRLLALIAEVEDPISQQITDIKEAAERQEEERIAKIELAIEVISEFAEDRHSLSLGELEVRYEQVKMIALTEDLYQEQIERAGIVKEDAEMKLRITIRNEQERLEELDKQEKIRLDNEAKQKELDERQAKMDDEEAERKAAQKTIDDDAAFTLAKENAEKQAKLDEQAEEQRKAQKLIDDENARIAQEKADKEEGERQDQQVRDANARALRLAPDTDKLLVYAEELETAMMPTVESDEAKRVVLLAVEKLNPVIQYIRDEARKLK